MVNNCRLSEITESTEPLRDSLNNNDSNGVLIINKFVIKKEPGFTYSVHTEKVHYQDGDYLRTSLKEIGFSPD